MKYLLGLIIIVTQTYLVIPLEESICAGIPYDIEPGSRVGLRSMGWSNIYDDHTAPLNAFWASNHPKTLLNNKDTMTLDISYVQDPITKSLINGWLSVTVKPANWAHVFAVFAIWATTETRDTFGEFLNAHIAQCGSSKLAWNDATYLIPCSAAPINEPLTPNMFLFKNAVGVYKDGIRLLWRTSIDPCNAPEKFRFIIAYTSSNWEHNKQYRRPHELDEFAPVMYSSPWLQPKIYGPPYALRFGKGLPAKFKCNFRVDKTSGNDLWAQMIFDNDTVRTETKCELEDDPWTLKRWDQTTKEEIPENVIQRSTCKAQLDGAIPFGGRCTEFSNSGESSRRVFASDSLVQQCISRPLGSRALTIYEDHIHNIDASCRCPDIPETLRSESDVSQNASILTGRVSARVLKSGHGNGQEFSMDRSVMKYTDTDHLLACNGNISGINTNDLGLCIQSIAGRIVNRIRQWHAVSVLFCTVVIHPITFFMARYLKGTFSPQEKRVIPIKPWYIAHIAVILPALCLYISGMAAIFRQRPILGYSYHPYAQFHRVGGYFIFGLIIFLTIFGFLRPTRIVFRKLAIHAHWLGGAVVHYLGLILCILAYRIPGSPTTFVSHVYKKSHRKVWRHWTSVVLIVWTITDILFHAVLTFRMMMLDHKMSIERQIFPVIIPLMFDDKERDQRRLVNHFRKEEKFNASAFKLYAVLSFTTYVICCITVYYLNNGKNEGFGPMYCTHDTSGNFLGRKNPNLRGNSKLFC